MRRRVEQVVAGTAMTFAAAFTAFVLVWHFVLDDAFWTLPPAVTFHGFDALALYPWAELALYVATIGACGTAVILVAMGKPKQAGLVVLTTLICAVLIGVFVVHLPVAAFIIRRIDRIRGNVEHPVPSLRLLVRLISVVLVAHAALIVAAGTRHTPDLTRRVAAASGVVTCAVFLHLFWIVMVFPMTEEWLPHDWWEIGRLRPVRACRGATLWHVEPARSRDPVVHPIGRIDDLWLQFADPRSGRDVRAISFIGTFREGYYWLTLPETQALRIREDDPAMKNCDGTWRRDPVAPAAWHKIGWPD